MTQNAPARKTYTTSALAELLEGKLIGSGDVVIDRATHPTDVKSERDLALAMDSTLLPLLSQSLAIAAVISDETKLEPGRMTAAIVVSRPRVALARLTSLFAEPVTVAEGVHPTAVVEPGAKLGANIRIGALAYIGANAVIGDNCTLHPQTYIGPDAVIGKDTLIYPGVRVGSRVTIGARCIIHFNTSIGADGFSFVTPQRGSVEEAKSTGSVSAHAEAYELIRISSLGAVVIGDDVEIGANSSIDRGTLVDTRIGSGTKIDNQVQVGHNVIIGKDCMICGAAGVAGSTVVGDRVVIGGASCLADHIKVGDDAVIMGMSGVAGNVLPRSVVGGFPAMPREKLVENHFYFGRIKIFMRKIEEFTKRLDRLEQTEKSD
jgi:UDP-3-O-[3-hydroxymyristoyl] glucosamine N-acyltransferase